MILRLSRLEVTDVIGTYGVNEDPKTGHTREPYSQLVPGGMPDRLRAMNPEAAAAIRKLTAETGEHLVVSDMLRSPQSSLHVSQIRGRSALPPSMSGHNYGNSLDLHVEAMLARLKLHHKRDLDAFMAKADFYCFFLDGREGVKEWWHYNHLPAQYRDKDGGFSTTVTTGYLEAMIQKQYGAAMHLNDAQCQAALHELEFYDGAVDGQIGRLSKLAIGKFQAQWMPGHRTGALDQRTQRLLAFLTATVEWVPLA